MREYKNWGGLTLQELNTPAPVLKCYNVKSWKDVYLTINQCFNKRLKF
jgi:hypothetical protein